METDAPTHRPGEDFGPYRLERPLGRGAAAEVWEVVESGDLGFTKRQALKLLQPPRGEMEAQKKALINEARVCGHLKHPGVVDVYRVGAQDGELYIAMEFVDGPDLNTLLVALRRRGIEIPVGAALDAAIDLADALDYAHAARDGEGQPLHIVHRDLKPSNVLVDRRGVLKISDWGLVKSTINVESTTRGIVKGTPGYIAPEVWGGTRDFRPAADLFAVGAMLFEFLVGERLFQGRNLARIAEQVARRRPEDEAARVAERCPELVPVLARLLQRVPLLRHQDGAELVDDLRAVREHYPGRETLRRFLREVGPILDEVAPPRLGSSRLRGMPAPPEEELDPGTDRSPAQIAPAPSASPLPAAPSEPSAGPVPATRQMEPTPAAPPPASPPRAALGSPSAGPVPATRQMEPTPAAPPPAVALAGPPQEPLRRRRRGPPGGKGTPERARRAPPPTIAVLIAVVGALTLLVGLLATLLLR